jgi:hypothetical protein
MTALPLNPHDNNYLSCRLINEQLTDNKLDVTLADDIAADVTNQEPKIVLDGTGRASLQGAVTIDGGSPTANYPLFTLPSNIVPTKDYVLPVAVLRAGDYIPNAITIQTAGSTISGATITTPGSYATLPTLAVVGDGVGASLTALMKTVTITVATAQSGAGSYAPNDTVQLAGGTFSTRAVGTVATTKVASATVAAGGSGGTDGTQTVVGTTGIGTKFQASVTVASGAITAVLSITVGGSYATNPTSLTNEPVTGASLTGAQLSVKMGINTIGVTTAGSYSVLPADPVSQFATSGSGTGATFTVLWGLVGVTVANGGQGYTEDNTTITVSGGGGSGGGALTPIIAEATSCEVLLVDQPTASDIVYLDGASFLVEPYR